MVYLLAETPQGYGLFTMRNDSLLEVSPDAACRELNTTESVTAAIKLESFRRFKDMKEATEEAVKLQEGKMGSALKRFLKKSLKKKGADAQLAVMDKTLGKAIGSKFKDLRIVFNPTVHEVFRALRTNLETLIGQESPKVMAVSLAHSLSRYKLKFSPEKVDVMIIQAVGLLEDLDKETNNLAMRLREWYGFHFPELLKLVEGNELFAKLVLQIGMRTNCKHVENFGTSELPITSDIAAQIRCAAETSMGSELVDSDLECINELARRVLALYAYRAELTDYLRKRMEAIAPNLTALVGETLGAKLLAQAGSLADLAKQPASTVQILGAEKALFRALKTKSNTPKYGLIFHAKCVGAAPPRLKGKMSRAIANKIALCVRADAYTESAAGEPTMGIAAKAFCERRLEQLGEENLAAPASLRPMPRYTPSRLR